jgi:hypothetical protein
MLRISRTFGLLAVLAFGFEPAFGFSLIGPFNEPFEVVDLGFNVSGREDAGAPKNLGEEYRHNTPVLYYAYDANFLDYFGAAGTVSVDQAFAVFNNLTNVSAYSPDLSEIPLEGTRNNVRAQTLSLMDLKSATMSLIIENLGLADPIRYMWNLHDRYLPPGGKGCPITSDYTYTLVMRNFDATLGNSLTQYKTSSYVNGELYAYGIWDYCGTPPAGSGLAPAEAIEIPVDTDYETRLPVASGTGWAIFSSVVEPVASYGIGAGYFYTGLTRDDVGGLRYLLQANNMNVESAAPNSQLLITNSAPQAIYTSNLTLFAAQALTNDAAGLIALYPGLIDTSVAVSIAPVWTTNAIPYFTNAPWEPPGAAPVLAWSTNIVFTTLTYYQHSFGNVFVVSNISGQTWVASPMTTIPPPNGYAFAAFQKVSITNAVPPYSLPGTFVLSTNISTTRFLTNVVVGDFFISTTNFACGVSIGSLLASYPGPVTNVLLSTTNAVLTTTTNTTTTTGTNAQSFTENLIIFATNHVFVARSIDCVADTPELRQGIEKINFIRRDYDSLLSRIYYAVTNEYILNAVSNNAIVPQRVQRVVSAPDIVITATDLATGPAGSLFANADARSFPNFNVANVYPGLAGPGTIDPPLTITFSKASPIWITPEFLAASSTNSFLEQVNQLPFVFWGSYDGTTNAPVVYPNDKSLADLEDQVLVQISLQGSSDGTVGRAFSDQLQLKAYTPNWDSTSYTWGLAPSSPGLPPGLNLDPSGLISGTPTQDGSFDFIILVTDSQGRTVERSFSIKIVPSP